MSGLAVWSIVDGRLLNAAGDHDASETVLPPDELVRVRRGGFTSAGRSRGGGGTFDVFVTFDADRDNHPDVVVEILLPDDPINAAVIRSTVLLYGGALIAGVAWPTIGLGTMC